MSDKLCWAQLDLVVLVTSLSQAVLVTAQSISESSYGGHSSIKVSQVKVSQVVLVTAQSRSVKLC